MKHANLVFLISVSIILCVSCANRNESTTDEITKNNYTLKGDYSLRPNIEICPINAFSSSFDFGAVFNLGSKKYIPVSWPIESPFLRFVDDSVKEKETSLADAIEKARPTIYCVNDVYVCCFAGITSPIKIYADSDIDGYASGEDLSSLFLFCSLDNEMALVNTIYPEFSSIQCWTRGKTHQEFHDVIIPLTEFFAVGTSPLLYLGNDTFITTIDGYESLLNGSVSLHLELPIIGINSKGEEESRVLKGDLN
ncbi:MAG: hypothetical protein IK052_08010 [Bacteroidales bacterium]|nr:hypothetical protein [Bacteroidales bacterium]